MPFRLLGAVLHILPPALCFAPWVVPLVHGLHHRLLTIACFGPEFFEFFPMIEVKFRSRASFSHSKRLFYVFARHPLTGGRPLHAGGGLALAHLSLGGQPESCRFAVP